MQTLDSKVHGRIFKNKDNTEIPPDEFIFRPHDNCVPQMLEFYRAAIEIEGAKPEQMQAVDRLIERVRAWREANPKRCKVADVEPGELRE